MLYLLIEEEKHQWFDSFVCLVLSAANQVSIGMVCAPAIRDFSFELKQLLFKNFLMYSLYVNNIVLRSIPVC